MVSAVRLCVILALMTLMICLVFCQAESVGLLLVSKVAVWPVWRVIRCVWMRWGRDPLVARVIR